ncbi:MAG: aldehyde ferredoxin oxidoreductase C-terminal domain-containing protein, partial [Anaerolineae bacterium]
YEVKDGKWIKGATERPEYETAASFGTLLLNKDPEAIFACNDICNRYGLDTISTGMTIAWAMECYEKGILTKEELGGIDLTWGNAEAVVALTKAIAEQTGIGKVLAKGSAKAADELGKGHECLITVKGIELPMHDPRLSPGYARTYQFDPTPGRHVKGGLGGMQLLMPSPAKYIPEGTGFLDVLLTASSEVESSAGLCMFSGFVGMQNLAQRLIEAVTGWSFKGQDVLRTGARILNMRHAFNLREGFKPADFVIPPRAIGVPPLQAGPLAGVTVNAQRLAENFFHFIGWDMQTGKPSKYSLERLGGMDDVIKDLYG